MLCGLFISVLSIAICKRMMGSKKLMMFSATIGMMVIIISSLIAFNNPDHDDDDDDDDPSSSSRVTVIGAAGFGQIPMDGGAVGAESFAFDDHQSGRPGPFTGVSDGRILRWDKNKQSWTHFAVTSPNRENCGGTQTEHICGRPLGMGFSPITGDLYIADAYMGLLRVGPEGGLASNITIREPKPQPPVAFSNGLDISQYDGTIYFTDSSTRYSRRNFVSIILSGDRSGRLMKYDPASEQVTVLLDNLYFPNGVSLSENEDYILFAETSQCRILRYWLKTFKAGSVEIFKQVPGFPDNVKRSPRGGFWVAIHSRRSKLLGWILSNRWIGVALTMLPLDLTKTYTNVVAMLGRGSAFAVRLSEKGEVVEVLEDKKGGDQGLRSSISEVYEKDGTLWIGSISTALVGTYDISKAHTLSH